jgi:hypothetical protein
MAMFQNIHSLLSRESVQEAKEMTLRPEQIIYGKVNKIYPNNIAVVQIGSHNVIAELQAPLTVNERYWFQVTYNDSMLFLKVLEQVEAEKTNSKNDKEYAIQQLIKKWSLSSNAGKLLQFLLKENLPVIKGHLLQAVQWIGKTEDLEAALQAIKLIYANNLPFTKETFEAMKSLEFGKSLTAQLLDLKEVIKNLPKPTETSQKLLEQIDTLLNGQPKITGKQAILTLLGQWLKENALQIDSQASFSLLQKLGVLPKHATETEVLETAAKQLSGIKQSPLLQKLIPSLSGMIPLQEAKNVLAEAASRLLSAISSVQTKENLEQFRSFLSLFQSRGDFNETEIDILLKTFQNENMARNFRFSEKERQLLKSIFMNNGESETLPWDSTEKIARVMKQIVRSLGLQYEADLHTAMKAKTIQESTFNELKPLLLKTLQEFPSHLSVKEAVEPLIQRITAQQLLTQAHGPVQNIFLQFPLRFGSHLADVTAQWQGKKQTNGQIDPNYCRILFYLDLQLLKETVIDVHIQNRVVNISIINETTGLQQAVTAMQPMLKESLEKHRYKLSSVKVIRPEKQNAQNFPPLRFSTESFTQESYSGVDYRV